MATADRGRKLGPVVAQLPVMVFLSGGDLFSWWCQGEAWAGMLRGAMWDGGHTRQGMVVAARQSGAALRRMGCGRGWPLQRGGVGRADSRTHGEATTARGGARRFFFEIDREVLGW